MSQLAAVIAQRVNQRMKAIPTYSDAKGSQNIPQVTPEQFNDIAAPIELEIANLKESVIYLSRVVKELKTMIEVMDGTIPAAFTKVLAGPAANGALGGAEYVASAAPTVLSGMLEINKNIEKIDTIIKRTARTTDPVTSIK
jgi:methyl-accepting chemotaxis protein